jgi:FG-GAP repeat
VITPSDPAPLNYFGWSVSVSGDYLIVGAWGANATYIFARSGSLWVQQAKLEPTTGTQSGTKLFGQSVAISGDYAVVGDTSDNEVAPGAGAAYVFQRKGMAWPLVEKITAGDAKMFDSFGTSVAIDGSVVGGLAIVGAPEKAGAAYLLSEFPAVSGGLPDLSKYSIYAKILFGLTGGGGGVIWLPGVGPVPVDPEPFKAWSTLSPTKRDVLVGLALSEIANLIYDGKVRQDVKKAGVNLVKQAASQLRLPGETEIR